jgi:hypothetical protein
MIAKVERIQARRPGGGGVTEKALPPVYEVSLARALRFISKKQAERVAKGIDKCLMKRNR